jgi:hypothetical protein
MANLNCAQCAANSWELSDDGLRCLVCGERERMADVRVSATAAQRQLRIATPLPPADEQAEEAEAELVDPNEAQWRSQAWPENMRKNRFP